MTISEQNILRRWSLMASKDLGTDINPITYGMADLAKAVLEEGFNQVNLKGYSHKFIALLRGFSINFGDYEEIDVVTCLDLSYVNISKYALDELDFWLMMDKHYADQYRYALGI